LPRDVRDRSIVGGPSPLGRECREAAGGGARLSRINPHPALRATFSRGEKAPPVDGLFGAALVIDGPQSIRSRCRTAIVRRERLLILSTHARNDFVRRADAVAGFDDEFVVTVLV